MVIAEDEIFSTFITELREKALSDFRHSDLRIKDRYSEKCELSVKLSNILKELSEEKRQVIE